MKKVSHKGINKVKLAIQNGGQPDFINISNGEYEKNFEPAKIFA